MRQHAWNIGIAAFVVAVTLFWILVIAISSGLLVLLFGSLAAMLYEGLKWSRERQRQ